VRRQVERQPNVRLYPRCRAQSLETTSDGSAVEVVKFENNGGSGDRLQADLVVDASVRGTLTLGLLEAVGQRPPQETVIGVDLGMPRQFSLSQTIFPATGRVSGR
jgi:flavin-dependent dehydrogenase